MPVAAMPAGLSGDQVNLSPPEIGPTLPSATLGALQANYQETPESVGRVEEASPEERLSARSLGEVARGGSASGIERGPSYGSEAVEMPGQVAGSGGTELVLHKERPEEALSQVAQEQSRQEVSRSSAAGQADRARSLEEGLQGKRQALHDGRLAHQRELVADAAKLEGGRQQSEHEKVELGTVASHERGLAAQLDVGQQKVDQMRLEEVEMTGRGLSLDADTRQTERLKGRASGSSLIKGRYDSDHMNAQKRQREFEKGLRDRQDRRGRLTQDIVLLRQSRERAASRGARGRQELERSQDRLQADQASFQDRKQGDSNIEQRAASLSRQADNASRVRTANQVNQQGARGNAVYLRQTAESLERRGGQGSHEFKQRSLLNVAQESGPQSGGRPRADDRGELLVVQLKPLNGGVGGVESLDSLAASGSQAHREGLPALQGTPDVSAVSRSSQPASSTGSSGPTESALSQSGSPTPAAPPPATPDPVAKPQPGAVPSLS